MADERARQIARLLADGRGTRDWRSDMDMPAPGYDQRRGEVRGEHQQPTLSEAGPYAGVRSLPERAGNAVLDYGPLLAQLFAAQPMRAGESIAEAVSDPTLANVTNAGVQSALAAFRPVAAAGSLVAGMGIGAARDAGLFNMNAEASDGNREAELRRVIDQLAKERSVAVSTQRVRGKGEEAAKAREELGRSFDIRLQGYQDELNKILDNKASAERRASEIKSQKETDAAAEYGRSVSTAEQARDAELARQRRFSDTDVGKVWDKAGGFAPFVVGAGLGGLTRAANGGGTMVKDYIAPMLAGTLGGMASSNIPLAYNAFGTEPDNPEQRAYAAYSRELPPDHPRKQEWADYAAGLPKANPVREAAANELYDWDKAKERMLFGAIEGVGGGMAGSEVVRLPKRILETLSRVPGTAVEGFHTGMKGAYRAEADAAKAQAKAFTGRQGVQELRGVLRQDQNALRQDSIAASEVQRRIGGPAGGSGQSAAAQPPPQPLQTVVSTNPASVAPAQSTGTNLTAADPDRQLIRELARVLAAPKEAAARAPRVTAKQKMEADRAAVEAAAAAEQAAAKQQKFRNLFGG